jgi:uncharacterized protein YjdB
MKRIFCRQITLHMRHLLVGCLFALLLLGIPRVSAQAATSGLFEYSVNAKGACITRYTGDEINCKIPSKIDGHKVYALGQSSFSSKEFMQTVQIPSTVTEINGWAFEKCTALTSITIPDSVTSLCGCFKGCTALKTVKIGKGVTSLSSAYQAGLFEDCTALTTVTLPKGLTTIESAAFAGCASLTSIELPSALTYIGYGAFSGCDSLTEIVIPDNVTTIKSLDGTFGNCASLKKIVFGKKITEIPTSCARSDPSLTTVIFRGNVTSIGKFAFYGDSALTEITLPSSVETIRDFAFEDCTSLTSVKLNNGLDSIALEAFAGCKSLREITIPSTVNSIDRYAFEKCTSLKSVQFLACWRIDEHINNYFGAYGGSDLVISCYSNSQFLTALRKNAKDYSVQEITAIPSTGLKLNKNKVSILEGESARVTATVTPTDSTDSIYWSSSNKQIATVTQTGLIRAVGGGVVTITAQTNSGAIAQVNVTCKAAPTYIRLNHTALTLKKGKHATLKYSLSAGSVTSKLTWKSSNKKIATVNSSGKVTAKKKGSCTITVTTHNGKSASCKITVR